MTAGGRRQRARRGEGDALRGEILAAAAALLAETGDEEAVSMRAVAGRVGVTPPSIYLHFDGKQALLEAVSAEAFDELDARLASACAGAPDSVEALLALGHAYVDFALERPEPYRFLFMRRAAAGLAEPTEAEARSLGALARVLDAVRSAQREGLVAPDREPLAVTYALWAAVHGVASLLISKPHYPWGDRRALVESVLAVFWQGVSGGNVACGKLAASGPTDR